MRFSWAEIFSLHISSWKTDSLWYFCDTVSLIVTDRLGKHKSRVSINHTVSKTFGSCKKATLERIKSRNQFMLLQKLDGYCDTRCIDVFEVRTKKSSINYASYQTSEWLQNKMFILAYVTKKWKIYIKVMSAEAGHVCAKICKTWKQNCFESYEDQRCLGSGFSKQNLKNCVSTIFTSFLILRILCWECKKNKLKRTFHFKLPLQMIKTGMGVASELEKKRAMGKRIFELRAPVWRYFCDTESLKVPEIQQGNLKVQEA